MRIPEIRPLVKRSSTLLVETLVGMSSTLRQPNFALLLGLAWLLIVIQLLAQNWGDTAKILLDTDDAMRLAQVHDWLAGRGWYDLVQPRVEPPFGLESHWSRLIDAGLAGLLWAFGRFFDPEMAERLMRAVWPMLWLIPTMAGAAAIAWRIAGREAAVAGLLLALVGLPAFVQFRPGRIDHHNVQIALALLAVAATVWSDRVRWAAWAAGAVTGFALAIGLECLPYLIVCGAAFTVRYVVDRAGARAAADYGLAVSASAIAGFFIIVAPTHWMRGLCDAIAVNWVALVTIGGLGLALAGRVAHERMASRLIFALAIATAASALFLAIEPRCLRGPFAMMDPAAWSIWAADVAEMQPLIPMLVKNPVTALGLAIFPTVTLLAMLVLLRSAELRRDFGFLTAGAAFLAGAVTTLAAIKGYPYATWLGMPLVAAFALHLFALLRLHTLVPRFLVGLLLTPAGLSVGAMGIAGATGIEDHSNVSAPEREACFATASYTSLAHLPVGLIAADVDFGPFLLALTPHSVLAAPYHRLSFGIVAMHDAFVSPPEVAHAILDRHKVTYLMTCASLPPSAPIETRSDASLRGQLRAGAVPAWLEPVPGSGPLVVYRLKAAG